MPWLDEGVEHSFLPNSIAEIINKKSGQNISIDINRYCSAVLNNDFSTLKNKMSQISQKGLYKISTDNQGNSSKEDKVLQFINDANRYMKNEDTKNAKLSIFMARMLNETNKYESEIEKIEFELIVRKELDKLIIKIKDLILNGDFEESQDLIKEATKQARASEEYQKKIEYLQGLINMQKLGVKFIGYVESNNFKKAIYHAVNLLKNDPNNNTLKNYISKLENQDKCYERCENAYKEIKNLYIKGNYIITSNEIKKVISLAQKNGINATKYEKLEEKILYKLRKD